MSASMSLVSKRYQITPVTKPRMTQRDKWKKRPAVLRYNAYKDEIRLRGVTLPESGWRVIFIIPMPKTWSEKKKREMDGQPHQQKPDKDNLEKGLLDALFTDDCRVWDGRVSKYWGREGAIIVGECNDNGVLMRSQQDQDGKKVCANCETKVPPGCGGIFRDDGESCLLNQNEASQ